MGGARESGVRPAKHRRRAACLIVAGAMALPLLGSANAGAATVTLGSSLTNPTFGPGVFGVPGTVSQTVLPGATLVAPFNGTIVRWSVLRAVGGPLKLRVVRPLGGGLFTGGGTATSGAITGTGVLTFQANLPIRAGDGIGLDPTAASDQIGVSGPMAGSSYDSFVPPLADGDPGRPPNGSATRELGFNAVVDSNCIVPSVLRLSLAAATAALEAANCDLGAVTKPKKKKAKKKAGSAGKQKLIVRRQSLAAGTEVPGGTDVALTLGKKKKKK